MIDQIPDERYFRLGSHYQLFVENANDGSTCFRLCLSGVIDRGESRLE